jgi:hypothetical protein
LNLLALAARERVAALAAAMAAALASPAKAIAIAGFSGKTERRQQPETKPLT